MQLYRKYRPEKFGEVLGQDEVVKSLRVKLAQGSLPQVVLLGGPSGVGKTTLARMCARFLKCSTADLHEINAADFRGIDTIRDIRRRMGSRPMQGKSKVWIIDEAHQLSKDAQNAALKMFEDTPGHVYFFLATTDPDKLLPTVRNRCARYNLKALNEKDLTATIKRVADKEGLKIHPKVLKEMIKTADGSPRQALVLLESIAEIKKPYAQMKMIVRESACIEGQEIVKALTNPATTWPQVAELLKRYKGQDVEQIRWRVLGYANAVMLNNSRLAPRCYVIITAFRDHWYDCKAAGLAAACYEILSEKF